MIDRLTEVAQAARIGDYLSEYPPAEGGDVTVEDAVAAVREARGLMSLAVVDASVLAVFYLTADPRRDAVVARLSAGDALFAPAHLDAEVVSALRSFAWGNPALQRAAPAAVRHLAGLPVRRMPLTPLLDRRWALRADVTAYDAAHVALAERLAAPVVTCDAKLAAASGTGCAFDLIS